MNPNEGQSCDDFLKEFLADQSITPISDEARGLNSLEMQNNSPAGPSSSRVFLDGKVLEQTGEGPSGVGWGTDSDSDVLDDEPGNKLTQILQESQAPGQRQQGIGSQQEAVQGTRFQQQQEYVRHQQGSAISSQPPTPSRPPGSLTEDSLTVLVRLNADKLRDRFPRVEYASIQQLLLLNGGDYNVVEQLILESQAIHSRFGDSSPEEQPVFSPPLSQNFNSNPNFTGQALSYTSQSPFDYNNNPNDYNNAVDQFDASRSGNAPQIYRFLEEDQGSQYSRGRRGGGRRGGARSQRGGREGFWSGRGRSGDSSYYHHDDRTLTGQRRDGSSYYNQDDRSFTGQRQDGSENSSYGGGRRGRGRGRGSPRSRKNNRSIDQYSSQNHMFYSSRSFDSSHNNRNSNFSSSPRGGQEQLQQQQSQRSQRPSTIRESDVSQWESDDEDEEVPRQAPTPVTKPCAAVSAGGDNTTNNTTTTNTSNNNIQKPVRIQPTSGGWESDESSSGDDDKTNNLNYGGNMQLNNSSNNNNSFNNRSSKFSQDDVNQVGNLGAQSESVPRPGPAPLKAPQPVQTNNNIPKSQGASQVGGQGSSVQQGTQDSSSWNSSSEDDDEPPKRPPQNNDAVNNEPPKRPPQNSNVVKQPWQTVKGKNGGGDRSSHAGVGNRVDNSQNNLVGNAENSGNAGNSGVAEKQVVMEDLGSWGSALEPLPTPTVAPPRTQKSFGQNKRGGRSGGRSSSRGRGRR